MELSILDYNLVHINPSEISAASLCLSMKLLGNDGDFSWDETMEFYSTCSEEHLEPTMDRLALLIHKPSSKQQVTNF